MRKSAFLTAMGAVALAGCVSNTPNDLANIQREEVLLASVISPARPADHIAQDMQRQPLETMLFAGVSEGQRVLELAPGDGYYTRLLAQAVGQTGRVYVVVAQEDSLAMATFQALAEQYSNIELVPAMASTSSIDLIWAMDANGNVDAVGASNSLAAGGILYVESDVLGDLVDTATASGLNFEGRQDRTELPVIGLRFRKP